MIERARVEVGQVDVETLQDVLTEHPAPAELVVARGVFASASALIPDDLYAKVVEGDARRARDSLRLDRGAIVTTDTYFGLLPASYFQRWTEVTEVRLKLAYDASGGGR